MIFHPARVAPEKAVFRPALPMCFQSGLTEKQMVEKLSYAEQLRHPFWQRKRLEVLEYFRFTCYGCDSKEKTLHVHHKRYVKGRKAWEYELEDFEALCADCHNETHESKELLDSVIAQFPSVMWSDIAAVLVGYGEEYVDPGLWLTVDETHARAGKLAWLMLNLKSAQMFEVDQCFNRLGPDDFLEALQVAVQKKFGAEN